MYSNKMKNKIIYKNIQEDLLKRTSKIIKSKEKSFFFSPQISGISLISQNEGTKKLLNKEKPKKEKKISNITNIDQIRLERIISKNKNKSNFSLSTSSKNRLFNNELSNKKSFIIHNFNTNLKNKTIKYNKNNNSTNSKSITKKLFTLDKDKSINKKGKKIKFKNNNNNPFSEKLKTNNKIIYNSILKNEIGKKNESKFDLEKNNKNNFESYNNTFNINKNKINYNKLNTEYDISKIIKINEQVESLYRKEKNNNSSSNQIKINTNMNNSSKLTNISSHASNLNSKKMQIGLSKKTNYDINKLKKIFLLKFKIDSNESETQEYESKFLNYDLGLSDEITTSNNNYLDEKQLFSIKEKNVEEYEKPVEEIEKLANEIYNSQYKTKKMSYIYNLMQNIDINDNTEELKEGEKIKTILSLNVNKKINKVENKK